jgi:hypothetical protein
MLFLGNGTQTCYFIFLKDKARERIAIIEQIQEN